MKKNLWNDFKSKSDKEIELEISKLQLEVKRKSLQSTVNKNKNTCEIREIKRSIARLFTILNQKKYEKKT